MARVLDFEQSVNEMVSGLNKKIDQIVMGSSEEQTKAIMLHYEKQ